MTNNFNDFKTKTSLIEIRYRGIDPLSSNESVEASLKAFDISLSSVQSDYINSSEFSDEATLQKLHDVVSLIKLKTRMKCFKIILVSIRDEGEN